MFSVQESCDPPSWGLVEKNGDFCFRQVVKVYRGARQIECHPKVATGKYSVVEPACELACGFISNGVPHSDDEINLLANYIALYLGIASI